MATKPSSVAPHLPLTTLQRTLLCVVLVALMLGIVPQHWQHLLRQAKCITLATEDYDGTEDASTDSTEKDVEEQPQKELNDRLLTQLFTFQCIPHSLLPICYGDSRPSTLLQAETPHATPPPERG